MSRKLPSRKTRISFSSEKKSSTKATAGEADGSTAESLAGCAAAGGSVSSLLGEKDSGLSRAAATRNRITSPKDHAKQMVAPRNRARFDIRMNKRAISPATAYDVRMSKWNNRRT